MQSPTRTGHHVKCRVVLAGVLAGRAFQQDLPFDSKCRVARAGGDVPAVVEIEVVLKFI